MNDSVKRHLLLGARALVSAALIFYLICMVEWSRVSVVLISANPFLLLAALPMSLFAVGCMALRWRLLLRRIGVYLSPFRLFRFYLMGGFFNLFLPGVIGGDVVRMACCARDSGERLTTTTGIVLLERVCGLVALFAVGGVVSLLVADAKLARLGSSLVQAFRLTAVLSVLVFLSAWLLGKWARTRLTDNRGWLVERLRETLTALVQLDLSTLAAVLALSAVAQGVDLLAAFVLAWALGIEVTLGLFFIIIPISYLVTLLPISLGGLGVREGIFSYLMTRVGVVTSDAVTLAFLIYLLRVAVGLMGGLCYLFSRQAIVFKGLPVSQKEDT
jgi:uncharacterized protein (TIRG00374 family)